MISSGINPYDDPDQRPVIVYSICHNEDDRDDSAHRRVPIEVFQRPVGDYEIFADGKPFELGFGICHNLAEAHYAIREMWGADGWDLRREDYT